VNWLTVTLALYRRAFTRAAALTLRNWPVIGSLFVYALVVRVAFEFAARLGFVGGILLNLVFAGCAGSFLYLVEMMVRTSRVTLEDFRRSAGAYLWDVVGVTFVVWLTFRVLFTVLAPIPQGPMLLLGLEIIVLVFFNAVPELIYLDRASSLELLRLSYVFIGENWIEWFPAVAALGVLVRAAAVLPFPPPFDFLQLGLIALLIAYAMVVRGLLFLELQESTRRSRAFRYRMGG
jgi:hypothetical protein